MHNVSTYFYFCVRRPLRTTDPLFCGFLLLCKMVIESAVAVFLPCALFALVTTNVVGGDGFFFFG